jgi:1-deoxy-D-xylulose-5-phosphate reductoisomerase
MSHIIEQTMAEATFIAEPTYEDYVETDRLTRRLATELL